MELLKFRHENIEDFASSPWLPTQAVLLYRAVFAGYCLAIWIYELSSLRGFYFIYLTHWTFMLITFYFTCSSIVSALSLMNEKHGRAKQRHISFSASTPSQILKSNNHDRKSRVSNEDRLVEIDKENELPWLQRGVWLLHAICCNASLMISVVYWAVLYRGQTLDVANISKHLLNAIFMLLDTALSMVPVRIFHSVYVIGYVMLYLLFTFIYWKADGTDEYGHKYIYRPLDYSKIPTTVVIIMSCLFIIIQPVIQAVLFGVFKARSFLYYRLCCNKADEEDFSREKPGFQLYLQSERHNTSRYRKVEHQYSE